MMIAKSRYPLCLWTLLIFFLILSFGYPFWLDSDKQEFSDCPQNFKISQLLIGCSVSIINTLIGCILDTFLGINVRSN